MLADLRIRNFAIIEDLEIAFEPGFNVITGETGAGKTILMRAIGLLLGDRGDVDLVRDGAAEAEIEALCSGPAVGAALGTEATETVVRRVIAANGRHRAFLDDRLVTTTRLAEIGERLVHVYGQHEHHTLVRPETQRALLDAAGGLDDAVAEVATRVRELGVLEDRLAALRGDQVGLAARRDLLAYQVQELGRAAPRAGELEELEQERERLRHAERLRAAASEAADVLGGEGGAVLAAVERQEQRLGELGAIDPVLAETARLLAEARPLLEEAALRVTTHARAISADPGRLETVEERVALFQRLARKHGCTPGELADRLRSIEVELGALEGGGDPEALEREVGAAAVAAWAAADRLSAGRARAAAALGKRVTAGFRDLALERAVLTVALEPSVPSVETPPARVRRGVALGPHGAERVVFLFAPNPGESPRPLGKIASGGELSRLMLALKAATVAGTDVPTLLFDEVDAGIGGAVAEAVGRKLATLAEHRQVICITHLPQIAACADHHFAVRKRPVRGRTRSSAERLSDSERVEELARMLAGMTITTESRRHAAEMRRLGRRRAE